MSAKQLYLKSQLYANCLTETLLMKALVSGGGGVCVKSSMSVFKFCAVALCMWCSVFGFCFFFCKHVARLNSLENQLLTTQVFIINKD